MVSSLDNIKFLHPVGVSTFKYGVSIPLEAQTERMRAIEKGGKVPVTVSRKRLWEAAAELRKNLELS